MIITIKWIDLCLHKFAYIASEDPYPSEDYTYFTVLDYIKDQYYYSHIQFSIRYY